jgi:alpha-ketoglutarate-dependent sulfate ester dioxygenase
MTQAPENTTSVELGIAPSSGYIGAEISGIDLRGPFDDATVAELRAALLKYKVIFFRDQQIGHAEQVAFARLFGTVTQAHPHEKHPPEGFPEVLPIDSRRFEARVGRKRKSYDGGWHTDVTAQVNPPSAAILRADMLPPYGGDTAFTNLVAAYEGLPQALKDFADTLDARHAFIPKSKAGRQREGSEKLEAFHPVVRVHPETGERALFVSPSFTSGPRELRGYTPRQSEQILELLWEEVTRPEYTVRFRWQVGSVAFWDNRATAHLAIADSGHLGYARVMYRVGIEGDIPRGVDGRESERLDDSPFFGDS